MARPSRPAASALARPGSQVRFASGQSRAKPPDPPRSWPIRSPSAVPPRPQTSLPNQSTKATSHVDKNKSSARDWFHGIDELAEARALDARSDIVAKLDSTDRAYLLENETAVARKEQTERELAVKLTNANAAARNNLSAALSALSSVALPTNPTRAAKLALAAWPRRSNDTTPRLDVTIAALGTAVLQLRERRTFLGHDNEVRSAAFSPDGTWVVTASADNTARSF